MHLSPEVFSDLARAVVEAHSEEDGERASVSGDFSGGWAASAIPGASCDHAEAAAAKARQVCQAASHCRLAERRCRLRHRQCRAQAVQCLVAQARAEGEVEVAGVTTTVA